MIRIISIIIVTFFISGCSNSIENDINTAAKYYINGDVENAINYLFIKKDSPIDFKNCSKNAKSYYGPVSKYLLNRFNEYMKKNGFDGYYDKSIISFEMFHQFEPYFKNYGVNKKYIDYDVIDTIVKKMYGDNLNEFESAFIKYIISNRLFFHYSKNDNIYISKKLSDFYKNIYIDLFNDKIDSDKKFLNNIITFCKQQKLKNYFKFVNDNFDGISLVDEIDVEIFKNTKDVLIYNYTNNNYYRMLIVYNKNLGHWQLYKPELIDRSRIKDEEYFRENFLKNSTGLLNKLLKH